MLEKTKTALRLGYEFGVVVFETTQKIPQVFRELNMTPDQRATRLMHKAYAEWEDDLFDDAAEDFAKAAEIATNRSFKFQLHIMSEHVRCDKVIDFGTDTMMAEMGMDMGHGYGPGSYEP